MVVVFTDLDGTLLEDDGKLLPEAREALDDLRARGIAVVPLTSKTRAELAEWLEVIGSVGWGAFEDGAGIVGPEGVEVLPGALGLERLREIYRGITPGLTAPPVGLDELTDAELSAWTGLTAEQVRSMRTREYDLPFLDAGDDGRELESALRRYPEACLTRGARFCHLHGAHDKADAVRILKRKLRPRLSVGLGDAPNDAGFLRLVTRALIVPRKTGPDPRLRALVPKADVAPAPAGAGWSAAVRRLLSEANGAEALA